MSSEEQEVYIMQDDDDEEWVSPTPARAVITEAVTTQTDLGEDDLDEIDTYVDCDELRGVLAGEGAEAVTFTVEGHDVTVDSGGDVTVQN